MQTRKLTFLSKKTYMWVEYLDEKTSGTNEEFSQITLVAMRDKVISHVNNASRGPTNENNLNLCITIIIHRPNDQWKILRYQLYMA